MRRFLGFFFFVSIAFSMLSSGGLSGCGGSAVAVNPILSVTLSGTGGGTIISDVGGGIDCNQGGGNCSASLDAGSVVTLTAKADSVSYFVGWSGGGCSGKGPCKVNLTQDTTVVATFDKLKIAFDSLRALDGSDAANSNAAFNIWTLNADGTGATPLTNLMASGADSVDPQWSPDGTQIVFESTRALDGSDAENSGGVTNIWVMNADGTGAVPLTHLTADSADCSEPHWSPDGTQIVFRSSRALDGSDAANANFTSNLWMMNADGTGELSLTNLTASGADSVDPQWSPDATQIVFRSSRALNGSDAPNTNSTSNIWRMNADGTGEMPLTNLMAPGAGSFDPQWSPDGTGISFHSFRALDGSDAANSAGNLWVMNSNGTSQMPLTNLTAPGAHSFSPQWSPDRTRVAFHSSRALDGSNTANANLTSNIWVMNSDGTGATPLTRLMVLGADSLFPQWSPDATQIIFESFRALDNSDAVNSNGTSNIWVAHTDGTGELPLTHLTAELADSFSPQWSR